MHLLLFNDEDRTSEDHLIIVSGTVENYKLWIENQLHLHIVVTLS